MCVSVCVCVTVTIHAQLYQPPTFKHRSVLVPLISMGLLRSDPLCYEATSPGSHTWPENVSYSSYRDIFISFLWPYYLFLLLHFVHD